MKPWKRAVDQHGDPYWTRGLHRIERWDGIVGHKHIYILSGPCGEHVRHVRLRDAKWTAERYDRKASAAKKAPTT